MSHALGFLPRNGLSQASDGADVFLTQQLQTVTGSIYIDVFGFGGGGWLAPHLHARLAALA